MYQKCKSQCASNAQNENSSEFSYHPPKDAAIVSQDEGKSDGSRPQQSGSMPNSNVKEVALPVEKPLSLVSKKDKSTQSFNSIPPRSLKGNAMNFTNGYPQSPAPFGPERMLRMPEVVVKVGFSKAKIYQLIKAGAFPKPCKHGLSQRSSSRWSLLEVEGWMRDQLDKRC